MDKKLNGWNDNKSPSSGIGGRPPYVERVAPNPQSEPLPETFVEYMSEARDEFVLSIKNVERSNYLLTAVDSFLICFDQMRDKLAAASTVSEAGEDAIVLRNALEEIIKIGKDWDWGEDFWAVKIANKALAASPSAGEGNQEEILKEIFDLLYAKYSFDKIETLQSKLKQSLCTKK